MNTKAVVITIALILVVVIVVGAIVGVAIHRRRRRRRAPAPAQIAAARAPTTTQTPSPTTQTNEPGYNYQYQQPPRPPPLPPALQCGDACQKLTKTPAMNKMHVDQDVGIFLVDAMQMFFHIKENINRDLRQKFAEARRIVRGKYTVSYPAMGIRCCDPRDPDAPCRLIELPPLKDVKNVFSSEFLPNVFIVDAQSKKRLYRIAAVEWADDQTAYPRVDILSESERVVVTKDLLEKYVPSLEWTVISSQTGAQRTRMTVHVDDALVTVVKRLAKMVKMLHSHMF